MSASTPHDDGSQDVRRHEVEITATHAVLDCAITCSRDGREPIEDVVPYEVVITVDLQNCTPPNEVVYQLDEGPRVTISAGGSATIYKRTANDETLRLWYDECFPMGHAHGRPETREQPKTPRVTLTLTKKGED